MIKLGFTYLNPKELAHVWATEEKVAEVACVISALWDMNQMYYVDFLLWGLANPGVHFPEREVIEICNKMGWLSATIDSSSNLVGTVELASTIRAIVRMYYNKENLDRLEWAQQVTETSWEVVEDGYIAKAGDHTIKITEEQVEQWKSKLG